MRRRDCGGAISRNIKSGGSSEFVRQNKGAARNLSLTSDPIGERNPAFREPFSNCRQDAFVLYQWKSQEFGNNLTGDVVRGRSKTAGDHQNVASGKKLLQRILDCRP